jgi:hypothetical protein
MNTTATNNDTGKLVHFSDWGNKYKRVEDKEIDTASVPLVAEGEAATSVELKNLIPHIVTYIEQYNLAGFKNREAIIIKLNMLETKRMRRPLDVVIEDDDEGFIARSVDLNLFGYGDDRIEAIDALKFEIESLYFDLIEDNNFSEEWLNIKNFLKELIIDS